jgi:hypothetical protein
MKNPETFLKMVHIEYIFYMSLADKTRKKYFKGCACGPTRSRATVTWIRKKKA